MRNQSAVAVGGAEQVNGRFVRLRDRASRDGDREERRLGSDEFLPLRTSRAADPDRRTRKTVARNDVSRSSRRIVNGTDRETRTDCTVVPCADPRISKTSERAGLQVPEIRRWCCIGLQKCNPGVAAHGGRRRRNSEMKIRLRLGMEIETMGGMSREDGFIIRMRKIVGGALAG
ncbi:unnamed protein product [Cuscuta campestris]|uniref:Uncharacterized protein n=1 Tax=Cuscuta campestris TaxID=132261 RepID=A0A484MZ09_9ASTE|nr:unnamed protein product [Cuscuta campestris]